MKGRVSIVNIKSIGAGLCMASMMLASVTFGASHISAKEQAKKEYMIGFSSSVQDHTQKQLVEKAGGHVKRIHRANRYDESFFE